MIGLAAFGAPARHITTELASLSTTKGLGRSSRCRAATCLRPCTNDWLVGLLSVCLSCRVALTVELRAAASACIQPWRATMPNPHWASPEHYARARAGLTRTVRGYALLLFLYNTGAKASEAAGVKEADLDLNAVSVKMHGKGGKQQYCPLWTATVVELWALALLLTEPPPRSVFLNDPPCIGLVEREHGTFFQGGICAHRSPVR